MAELEKVIYSIERCICHVPDACRDCGYDNEPYPKCSEHLLRDAHDLLKAQEPITGETSDGYHTFNELYHHRAVLFSVIVANYPDRAWKSKKHYDGAMYEGMFIVGIETPDGQATYHYDIDPYWDMFKCRVLDNAPEWDGHTPAQAIERIGKLKAQEPRVMTLEEVLAHYSLPPVVLDDLDWQENYLQDIEPLYFDFPVEDSWAVHWRGYQQVRKYLEDWKASYGKNWRCWTSRPTDEQRKETQWSEPPKEET